MRSADERSRVEIKIEIEAELLWSRSAEHLGQSLAREKLRWRKDCLLQPDPSKTRRGEPAQFWPSRLR